MLYGLKRDSRRAYVVSLLSTLLFFNLGFQASSGVAVVIKLNRATRLIAGFLTPYVI